MARYKFLAAVGDSNDPVTWSGIPYHFLQAAREGGVLDEGLNLKVDGAVWKSRRAAWNIFRILSGDRLGGYQYSQSFLENLWGPVMQRLKNNVVMNCFQLFAPSVVTDRSIEKWFFIDQTLIQLFDFYGVRSSIGRRIADDAIKREREGYLAAAGIIAHSEWAAGSLRKDYAMPRSRINVVVPGANLDPAVYARWEALAGERRALLLKDNQEQLMRLVFIGKNWERKGLDRLLRGLALARRSGSKATLKVIGCQRESLPEEVRSIEGVEWAGFFDKRTEPGKFLEAVAECDIGCLLSRAEAGGIAFREYHALGLAVLGTDAGGAPEHMLNEASVRVSTNATDEEIATTLLTLDKDLTRRAQLRASAWRLRRSVLWQESVRQIQAFWPHRQPDLEVKDQAVEQGLQPEPKTYGSFA